MKIGKGKNGFVPVTFTVETADEAIVLWQRLNLSQSDVRESINGQVSNQWRFDADEDEHVTTPVWRALDDALRDAGEKP